VQEESEEEEEVVEEPKPEPILKDKVKIAKYNIMNKDEAKYR
jgi:hypothetical protein